MFTLTQIELEGEMVAGGRERAITRLDSNADAGRAERNPYATPIFRRYGQALSDKIQADLDNVGKTAGRMKAHIPHLQSIEPDTVAYIAVRTLLVELLAKTEGNNGRQLIYAVGKNVQSEVILRQFKHLEPERFWSLQQELARRHSQDPRQHMTLALKDMRDLDLDPVDWGRSGRDQVGAYLVEQLRLDGFLEAWHSQPRGQSKKFKVETHLRLAWEVLQLIDEVKELVAETMPFYLPCVEQPLHWQGAHGGGYHTLAMQRMAPVCILDGNAGAGDCTELVSALNILQDVSWSINTKVLDAAKALARVAETEEIVSTTPPPQPEKPGFLASGIKSKDMSDEQQALFKTWRRAMAEWHTQMKLKGQKYGRMYSAFRVAEKFREADSLHFVYYADFRGRFYPRTTGINPQGSDLQRGLLQFGVGKPLLHREAVEWFLIHGANKFGVDKVDFDARIRWVDDNSDLILRIAADPVGSRSDWLGADKPFQFLGWCFEYAEWKQYGAAFRSRLAVSLDGSCNGLQNFSAMLRDEEGGVATNLIPNAVPQDIYMNVAKVTELLLGRNPDPMSLIWQAHGINRKVVKRSVMTLPYGSTQFSCRDFILQDYLRGEAITDIPPEDHSAAAQFLAPLVWEGIGKVVVKAREAMEWLQKCSSIILKTEDSIRWCTPTGFIVRQEYWATEAAGRVRIELFGGAQVSLHKFTGKKDVRRHRNGIAPNFIHSMDAAHMQRVALRAKKEGIRSLGMIHDDFGTHAADTALFSRIIREEFIRMYQQESWLDRFGEKYADLEILLPLPPEPGNLDITQVLDSKYFFA